MITAIFRTPETTSLLPVRMTQGQISQRVMVVVGDEDVARVGDKVELTVSVVIELDDDCLPCPFYVKPKPGLGAFNEEGVFVP